MKWGNFSRYWRWAKVRHGRLWALHAAIAYTGCEPAKASAGAERCARSQAHRAAGHYPGNPPVTPLYAGR